MLGKTGSRTYIALMVWQILISNRTTNIYIYVYTMRNSANANASARALSALYFVPLGESPQTNKQTHHEQRVK